MLPETDQIGLKILDFILAILSVPATALFIWLTIRIINRRERGAIRLAIFLVIACLLAGTMYLTIPRVRQ